MYGFVQSAIGTKLQSGSNPTVTLNGVTAGSLLVLAVPFASDNRSVSSVAGGGTWARGPAAADTDSSSIEFWYCVNATGGNTTVTLTMDAPTASNETPILLEYSGIKTSAAVQGTPVSLGWSVGASPRSTGSLTTTANGCLLVAVAYTQSASRPLDDVSGYTTRVNEIGVNTAIKLYDKRQAAAGAETFTITWTGGNATGAIAMMAFEESAAAGTAVPKILQQILNFRRRH